MVTKNADGSPRTPGTDLEEQARIVASGVRMVFMADKPYITTAINPSGDIPQGPVAKRAGELLEAEGFICGVWNTESTEGQQAWLIVTRTNEAMLEWIHTTSGAMQTIHAIE